MSRALQASWQGLLPTFLGPTTWEGPVIFQTFKTFSARLLFIAFRVHCTHTDIDQRSVAHLCRYLRHSLRRDQAVM